MAKRDRQDETKPGESQDPNAGYPGTTYPESTLAGKSSIGTSNADLAGNEPEGDASGRPGSSTLKHVDATTDAQNAVPSGSVRVKAKKTVLYGGIAYTEGQTFNMEEKDFDARKERGEFERA
jgi:hypothetical protein